VENQNLNSKKVKKIGIVILAVAVALLIAQYFGLIKAEISYILRDKKQSREVLLSNIPLKEGTKNIIVANNKEFALIIPKIGVNTKIIPNVDPFNAKEYQKALSQGVAHAIGTGTPADGKNTVIFAHSTDNFYNANKFNGVFYLLGKLSKGDEVFVVQESKIYKYTVVENLIVEPDQMEFMEQDKNNTLTLITCWPAGTTLKRRVIVAKLVQ
jgi:LPXTG-site transpeptidase (sortase) family protein